MTTDSYEERLKPVLDRVDSQWPLTAITIGEGWIDLLLDLDKELAQIAPDYAVLQVKEKFGALRFYYAAPPAAVFAFVEKVSQAAERSTHICEVCGQPGELRTERRWIRTLCDTHDTPQEGP